MGKPTGFKEITRETPRRRPVELRILDWEEVDHPFPEDKLRAQGRCMDCGIPSVTTAVPWATSSPSGTTSDRIAGTTPWKCFSRQTIFPNLPVRLRPAPCEEACVLGINDKPVTIKLVEQNIIDHAFEQGWVGPHPPERRTGKKVAVIGSGPAGLGCAGSSTRRGIS